VTIIPIEIKNLNIEELDFNNHESMRNLIIHLLNIIESHSQLIESLKKEIQSLKDEVNRLKGEKGKPKFSPDVSEKEEDSKTIKRILGLMDDETLEKILLSDSG
jgi:hypothetical protein